MTGASELAILLTLFYWHIVENENRFYKTSFAVQEKIPFVGSIELFLSAVIWPLFFFLTNRQVIHRFADMLHGTWIRMP